MYELWHRFFQPKKNDIDSYLILWIVAALHTNFGSHTDPSTLNASEEKEMAYRVVKALTKFLERKKRKEKKENGLREALTVVFFFFGILIKKKSSFWNMK